MFLFPKEFLRICIYLRAVSYICIYIYIHRVVVFLGCSYIFLGCSSVCVYIYMYVYVLFRWIFVYIYIYIGCSYILLGCSDICLGLSYVSIGFSWGRPQARARSQFAVCHDQPECPRAHAIVHHIWFHDFQTFASDISWLSFGFASCLRSCLWLYIRRGELDRQGCRKYRFRFEF